MRDMAAIASRSSRPSGCATSSSSCSWRRTRGPGWSCSCDSGLADARPARAARAAARGRRAPPPQGRLRALADRARAGHRPRGARRRAAGVGARARPRAAPGRPAPRRRQARDPPVRGGGRGLLPPPRGRRRQARPRSGSRRCASTRRRRRRSRASSSCTCASTATARASGPTPRCGATSPMPAPLLPRLHRLTRADCTTRNVRKARRLAATYDDLEQRIERLARATRS